MEIRSPSPPRLDPADAAYAARLARGSGALVALVYGLIVLGALVRARGAGLACPDWPLCFGELVPRFPRARHHAHSGLLLVLIASILFLTAFFIARERDKHHNNIRKNPFSELI